MRACAYMHTFYIRTLHRRGTGLLVEVKLYEDAVAGVLESQLELYIHTVAVVLGELVSE